MRHGDLSNKPSPRLVIVFENAVGILPDDRQKQFAKLTNKGKWEEAIALFELQELYMRKIMDLIRLQDFNVELVTWLGKDAALALVELMEEENLPIMGVIHSTPDRLARDLAYNPDIMCVYDPDPDHKFTYGSKGVVLLDPLQIGRIFSG